MALFVQQEGNQFPSGNMSIYLEGKKSESSKLVRGIQSTKVVCVIQNGMTKLALLNYLVTS